MIIKGKFGDDANDTYYKVDLTYEDDNHVTHYYHVLRNFKYKVQIKRLIGSGYETEEDAMQRPACNNISGSTLVSSLTNVSNGEYQLYVDNMDLVMVHNNAYQLKYRFVDLENMSFMDSSGIGVILGRYREIRQRGGEVAVKNMNPQVEKVFLLSGMNQVIKMI